MPNRKNNNNNKIGNNKRKKAANSSSSDSDSHVNSKLKHPKINDSEIRVSVSDLLNQANTVLNSSPEELDNSVFEHSQNSTSKEHSDMASSGANSDTTISQKLDTVINSIQGLKTSQDSMKRMFESKLDKLKTEIIASVDSKISALRDELTLDIHRETNRIDQLLTTVQSIQARVDDLETRTGNGTVSRDREVRNPLDDIDLTIVASGLPFIDGEDLIQTATTLIAELGEEVSQNVHITAATRLPSRLRDKPGLVKISFRNVDEKIRVLRNKMGLKNSESYRSVYIKSSKSRIERLIENNARAYIRNLPQGQGKSLRVDANGRIKPRNIRNDNRDTTD